MKIFEKIENLKNSKPELTQKLLKDLIKEIDCLSDDLLNHQTKSTGDTILHKLIMCLCHSKLVEIVLKKKIIDLIKKGAKIDIENKNFKTPLDLIFEISNLDILKWLKENNYIKFKDDHILKAQNKEVLNYLLNLGLNLNATNKLGTNLLYYTILNQDIDFACYLIKEQKIEIKNAFDFLCEEDIFDFLTKIAFSGDSETFKILINNYLKDNYEINDLLDEIINDNVLFSDEDDQDSIETTLQEFFKPFYQN